MQVNILPLANINISPKTPAAFALILLVTSELCCIVLSQQNEFYNTLGYLLKTVGYWYLLRSLLIQETPQFTDNSVAKKLLPETEIIDFKLEQQKILQQKKLAILGQMSAEVVHEIKNHLTTIKGFTQIIKSKIQDDKLAKYAQIIENTVNEINYTVSYFLSFAKSNPSVLKEVSVKDIISSLSFIINGQLY